MDFHLAEIQLVQSFPEKFIVEVSIRPKGRKVKEIDKKKSRGERKKDELKKICMMGRL